VGIFSYHAHALVLLAFVPATQQLPQLLLPLRLRARQVQQLLPPPVRPPVQLQPLHRIVRQDARSLLVVVICKVNRGVTTAAVGLHQNGASNLQVTVQIAMVPGAGQQVEDCLKDTEMFDFNCYKIINSEFCC